MDDEGSGKGVWIGLIIAVVAFLVFGVLWYLRGGEIDRLQQELAASASAANSARQRLESDLRSLQGDLAAANRRAGDSENRMAMETRRAADNIDQLERRLRRDADDYERRLADMNRKLEQALAERKNAAETETAPLRAELERAREEGAAAVERIRSDLAAAEDRAATLAAELAEKTAALEELARDVEKARETTPGPEAEPLGEDAEEAHPPLEDEQETIQETPVEESAGVSVSGDDDVGEEDEAAADVVPPEKDGRPEGEAVEVVEEASGTDAPAEVSEPVAEAAPVETLSVGTTAPETPAPVMVARADGNTEEADDDLPLLHRFLEEHGKVLVQSAADAAFPMEAEIEMAVGDIRSEEPAAADDEAEPEPVAIALKPRNERGDEPVADTPETAATPPAATAPAIPSPAVPVGKNPEAMAGRIVEEMDGGVTLLVTGGSRQNVRDGTVYDVYRQDGASCRMIGAIRVTRVMEDFSMAVVALSESGAGAEAPAIGDFIDNPRPPRGYF